MKDSKAERIADLLWAPWRMDYILEDKKGQRCIFCRVGRQTDKERLILYRNSLSLVMMNRYPYSYAHLMVAPVRHVDQVRKLKKPEMGDVLFCLGRSIEILRQAFRPDGFNVGMNLGQVAGAGVRHHIHFHIVPRWNGDTNFMPALAEVRVIPEHLEETFGRLSPYFKKLRE